MSWPSFPLNTDGLDLWGSNINVENVKIKTYDDAVVPKPCNSHICPVAKNGCTRDIYVRNATQIFGVGMSIGSVPPNKYGACVQNVTFEEIDFQYPLKAIYVKTNPGNKGYGIISDITYDRVNMYNPVWWGVYIGPQQ